MESQEMCLTPGRDASTASMRSTSRRVAGVLKKGMKGMPPQLVRFQVDLEEQNRVYFAGEELKGFVHVQLTEDLPMQGIILRIVGEAYVNVSDEPRPWSAAKRLGNLRRPFKSKKISPSNISNLTDSTTPNWETATTTTVTAPRSQRSTLQRGECPLPQPSKPAVNPKKVKEEVKFRAHEKYFEHKMYVFGHRYSSTRELMWKGSHSFNFSYLLPSKLPVSFHGRYGYVRYFCEASLERHNQPTIQRRAFFSVSNVMDLNNDSKADAGVSKEKKTNSWCFCCPSGTIIVSAKIRKRGYVPGEMIPLQAYVFNVSNKPIHKITAKIVQIATYFSSKGFQKKNDETVICEKVEGMVPPGESTAWDEVGPCVPPCPPSSTIIDCKLITIDYRLDFVLDIHKAKEPLTLRMPLRVGTVPMEKTFKNLMDPVIALDFGDAKSSFPMSVHAKYPKLPAVFSLKCIKGERNVNRYYFRQIPRSMQSMLGISGRLPQQPTITDEEECYAPRYLTYTMWPDKLQPLPERMEGPRIVTLDHKIQQNGTAVGPGPGESQGQSQGQTNHLLITVTPPLNHIQTPDTNGTGTNGTSAICSPASFRSYKAIQARAPAVELAHRLASMGTWDHLEHGHLRRRTNLVSEVTSPALPTLEDETQDKKND